MTSKELRLGNFVINKNGKIEKVYTIYNESINGYDGNGGIIPDDESNFKGIELTMEWFKDFGFEAKGSDPDFLERDNFSGIFSNGDFKLTWYELAPCRHVHELQNLFFAIKGKELDL